MTVDNTTTLSAQIDRQQPPMWQTSPIDRDAEPAELGEIVSPWQAKPVETIEGWPRVFPGL